MRSVQTGAALGLAAQLALLAALAATAGLSGVGWIVGVACGLIITTALACGLAASGADSLGQANLVTLARSALVGGCAALVADSFGRPISAATLVVLAVVALVMDGIDGWVARHTGTASALGARFDMEVDALLILVLSGYVARSVGAWVLAIGLARYAFVLAGRFLPWLRGTVPPRYWRKVVAATQGVVLTVAAADVLPRWLATGGIAAGLAMLSASFGSEVWWRWRHRSAVTNEEVVSDQPVPDAGQPAVSEPSAGVWPVGASAVISRRRRRLGKVVALLKSALAFALVWFALVAPNDLSRLSPAAFVRIPIEGLVLVILAVALPMKTRRIGAVLVGVVLGLLTVVKTIDMGFIAAFERPFDPMSDWGFVGPGVGVLRDSIGPSGATVVVVAAGLAAVALLVLLPWSVLQLAGGVTRHRGHSARSVLALGVVWMLFAVVGVQIMPGTPVAASSAVGLAVDHVREFQASLRDRGQTSAAAAAADPFRIAPSDQLLNGLRGKDVIVAFVESYGRIAVQDADFSRGVDAVLDAGTAELGAAGFSARSAFLTSPTFGGISWLAHSTLQSGLWIDSQQRYNELVASNRFTLSDAFKRGGWRTVVVVPSNSQDWPEGASFYHYDAIYDARNVGYAGPKFSYANMPDQYSLAAFHQRELAGPHHPVMAEIDLVSSHTPWAPLPRSIDWDNVGDGSAFDGMPAQGQQPNAVWRDPHQVQIAYGQSIEYSLTTIVSFVRTYGDPNLVLVVLGDHQPATIVTGEGASHDVPITIIAHDSAVLDRITGWAWQDGMRPDQQAPVWAMDAFRDRFLTAYGS